MSAKTKRKPEIDVPPTNGNAMTAMMFVPPNELPAPLLKLDFGAGPNPRDGFDGVDQYPFGGKVKYVMKLAEPVYAPLPSVAEEFAECFERKLIGYKPWPWPDCSVEEAHSSHTIEHLSAWERVHFFNELYRVLVPAEEPNNPQNMVGKCTIIVPHWASCRAYGDPSHQWPGVGEFFPYYLSREWRIGNPNKECPCKGTNKTCGQCGGRGVFALGANAPHTDASVHPLGFKCDLSVTWGYSMHQALITRNQELQQLAMQWGKEAIQDMILTATKIA